MSQLRQALHYPSYGVLPLMIYSLPVRQPDGSYQDFDTLRRRYGPGTDLESFLFAKPKTLKLYCITTWECTLRCQYCYVLPLLKKADRFDVNVDATIGFLRRYLDWNPDLQKVRLLQIGGEPLAAMSNVSAYHEVAAWLRQQGLNVISAMTTNLTVLPEDLEPLTHFDSIAVSIDGDEQAHNAARKNASLEPGTNVFRTVIRNLYRLLQASLPAKLSIQAAISDEMANDVPRVKAFRFLLEAMGLDRNQIHIGCIAPTNGLEATEAYKRYATAPATAGAPCCIFCPGGFLCLHDNQLYASYFDRMNRLGDLSSDPADVYEKACAFVRATMPVLNDPGCHDCPVLPYCWGHCYGDHHTREKPSTKCAREYLMRLVSSAAEDGTLPKLAGRKRHA